MEKLQKPIAFNQTMSSAGRLLFYVIGEDVSQDMRDSKFITMYKNKGEISGCNIYRGISLLNIVDKVFAKCYIFHRNETASRTRNDDQAIIDD